MATTTDVNASNINASATNDNVAVATTVATNFANLNLGSTSTVGAGTPTGIPITSLLAAQTEKPEKFKNSDFKRWQDKMKFYLTTLKMNKFLTEAPSVLKEGQEDTESVLAVQAWHDADYCCKHLILNCLDDQLYSIYVVKPTAKSLWETLELKYQNTDSADNKAMIAQLYNFTMVDTKSVPGQVEKLQTLMGKLNTQGFGLTEKFMVATIIEKLPTGWRDFQMYLKHKQKEMNMDVLVNKLTTEQNGDRQAKTLRSEAKANIVEAGSKRKHSESNQNAGASKKKKVK